ncbi:MAG: 4Fe-4S dicluster domain-containing protein [Candidatus Adiutrix sp.]|jgi:Fe-S oxidoreductase|nr:4Fe-4S dicluster domain-containing protein [Candidatus Adiutrix sp.]
MDKETLQQFEAQCFQEEPPACQTSCPLHLDARALAACLSAGKAAEARKILDRHMPLSGLSAYLCEGPCQAGCRRQELDRGLDLPLLERYCLSRTRAARFMAMPPTGRKIALLGAGLSSLALAWELARKGHQVRIFHQGPPGGRLRALPEDRLPEKALSEALEGLGKLKAALAETLYSPEKFKEIQADYPIVFLGGDDPELRPDLIGLRRADIQPDPTTLLLAGGRLLARPPLEDGGHRYIDDLAAARRAAGSIERLLQGVPPDSARAGEEVYATRLQVNLEGVAVKEPAPPADPRRPTEAEAAAEAGRCLQCQCLECVKNCVYLRHYQGYPKKTAREAYGLISTAFGIHTANTMVLSCAECGQCREICPNGADLGRIIGLLRQQMVETGHMPVSAHEFALEDMLFSNSIAFFRHQPGRTRSRWLFFPGCQLPASLPRAAARLYEHLSGHLDGGLGLMAACCGAPARWSGRPRLTEESAAFIGRAWAEAGRPTVITACPSCTLFFQDRLPDMPLKSLWTVLAELPLPEGAVTGPPLALHDPCSARMDQATRKSARDLMAKLGQPFSEPPLGGRLTRCCGYGGLASAANPGLADDFARDRSADTEAPLAAYCVMCRDRLRAVGHPTLHLLDLLFPEKSPAEALKRPGPGISDRQENRRAFRLNALKEFWAEEPEEDQAMDVTMHIPEELAELLEKRRILRSDLAGVLKAARAEGPQFVNRETGRHLACLRPRQVTFWVEYSPRADGSFDIHDAYGHRMLVPGVPGEGADSAASREGFDPMGGRR